MPLNIPPPPYGFDAHCHLQDERLAPHLDAVMERAAQAGVTTLMCCGTSETDWPAVTGIAARFATVRVSFGLHPWYAMDCTSQWIDTLQGLLQDHPAGIGEIGLDHALAPETFAAQEEVFLTQLTLATELERPVSVHCRRAWGRLMELLDDHGWPPRGILLHSYSGGPGLVTALVHRGAWFSFSGAITHDNNLRGRDAVIAIPEDRLLVETDAPDLMPTLVTPPETSPLARHVKHLFHPHPAPPINEPANLPIITAAIASLRHWTPDQATQITRQNAETFFGK